MRRDFVFTDQDGVRDTAEVASALPALPSLRLPSAPDADCVNNFRCTSAYRRTLKDESAIVRAAMDASYFWQKAATCLRLAQTLSLNNPGRVSLLEMAQAFERRAKEIEATKIEATRIAPSRAQSNQDTSEDSKREHPAIGMRRRFV